MRDTTSGRFVITRSFRRLSGADVWMLKKVRGNKEAAMPKYVIERDIPGAVVRFFDTSHFALETHAGEISDSIRDFLN